MNGSYLPTPPTTKHDLCKLVKMHMGSSEVFFLWILKKCKLDINSRGISDAHFTTGVRGLVEMAPDAPRAISEKEMPDLFTRSGGRVGMIKMEKFLQFFKDETGPFEMEVPPLVETIAAHKITLVSELSKISHNGKTVSTTTFKQLVNSGFHPDVTQKDWDDLSYIADPFSTGEVQYRIFINRCALRLDAHRTHSTRRRDTVRRDRGSTTPEPKSLSFNELIAEPHRRRKVSHNTIDER